MTPDTKKIICELAKFVPSPFMRSFNWSKYDIPIDILMRAVFAINRGGEWEISIFSKCIEVTNHDIDATDIDREYYEYKDHNNSEIQALSSAVEYVIGAMGK